MVMQYMGLQSHRKYIRKKKIEANEKETKESK